MTAVRGEVLAVAAALVLLAAHAQHGWPGRSLQEVLTPAEGAGLSALERFLERVDRELPRHDPVLVWYRPRPPEWHLPLVRWQATGAMSPRPDPGATFGRYYLGPRPVVVVGLESDERAGELAETAGWLVVWGAAGAEDLAGEWEVLFSEGQGTLCRRRL